MENQNLLMTKLRKAQLMTRMITGQDMTAEQEEHWKLKAGLVTPFWIPTGWKPVENSIVVKTPLIKKK